MAILTATQVEKKVNPANPIHILRGVNLSVNAGETLAIMGASGSGKTTLLSLLAGLDVPTQGEIIVDGNHFSSMNEEQRALCRLGKIGFIFQNFDLLPHFTALENVMLPLELCEEKEIVQKAKVWMTKVGLENRYDHFPAQLSGGEQQRVAIARAFATQPKVLFADEPTGNLDINTGEKIMEVLFELNTQNHTTLIFITHDLLLAKRCQRILVLEQGQLVPFTGNL